MLADFSIANKTALVTGAGRGICTGVAEVFLDAGATVVVNALTDKFLGPFVDGLRRTYGDKVVSLTGDATTEEGAAKLLKQTADKVGPLDILVNGVGDGIAGSIVPVPGSKLEVHTDADIKRILGLNMMSAIYCTRAAAAGMLERRRGKIINFSTGALIKGSPTRSVYTAGKAGLVGLTKTLALEWAPFGVTVNAISPGIYPDFEHMTEERAKMFEEQYMATIPLRRFGKFREVGLLALYLASPASDYMTGQVLSLDGGLMV
jgi:NAD(P)-dependent dehydrogenase (short-subunit alcohol dehydrogenase family)